MKYNLGVLNDKEFEDLCKDLLDKKLGIDLQSFKKGKDKGTDLRYANTVENEIVVQAKHFINSKYSDLKHQLLVKELKKIKAMSPAPQRYIVTTSLGLNPTETDELYEGLKPYVLNSNDIYGLDRIESLLDSNAKVIEKFYKLWLTSTSVLNRVIHNGIKGKSEFHQGKILKKVGLYVQTNNYRSAEDKILEHHFVIISGPPGIGKTTIAYLLICNFLANDYELIYVDDQLKDAENLISSDPEQKQIIFFDDFLGSNIIEINNPRNTESSIVSFIERLQHLKNKYLILTTRTTILNQAIRDFEKFKRNRLGTISKYEIQLENYDPFAKAQILYNHLYQANVSESFYDVFVQDKNYVKIIDHKNYSPRLIEFITQMRNFKNSSASNLKDFIFDNLENPQEIWRDAYENQLVDEDRFLLTALFSLGGYNIAREYLEAAFKSRYDYEIKNHGFQLKHNAFANALKKLLDGFIVSYKDSLTGINYFSFLNPSVGDFLLNYIKENDDEKIRLLYSLCYVRQLSYFFHPSNKDQIKLSTNDLKDFFPYFQELTPSLKPIGKESKAVEILYIYLLYFPRHVSVSLVSGWLDTLREETITENQFARLLLILESLTVLSDVKEKITEHWDYYIIDLIQQANSMEELKSVIVLFEKYGISLIEFLSDKENKEHLQGSLNAIFTQISNDEDFSYNLEDIMHTYYSGEEDEAKSMVTDKLWDMYTDLITECGLSSFQDDFVDDIDLNDREVFYTLVRNYGPSDDYDRADYDASRPDNIDVYAQIDELFSK
jgi:DNA polymerase III delta prime subunit